METTMRDKRILVLVEIALAIALAAALNFIAARLPINVAGGSISLAMLPIAVVALRRGALPGLAVGFIFGSLDLLFEPFIVHWVQVFLDYPLPYAFFGLATGLFSGPYLKRAEDEDKSLLGSLAVAAVAIIFGGLLRLATHVISGVVFFAEYAGGQNVWVYSIVYNLSYVLPSLTGALILALILLPILDRALPVKRAAGEGTA
jgi:thiamine transporter